MIGIYCIENIINHKKYIGKSNNIDKRFLQHKNNLKNDKSRNYDLYNDMELFGLKSFKFYVLEECDIESLNERENYYIEKYNTVCDGYNHVYGGDGTKSLSTQDLDKIENMLLNNVPHQEIANKMNVSRELIQGINTGRYYFRDNKTYPIKDYKKLHKSHNGYKECPLCGNLMAKSSDVCIECYLKNKSKNIPSKEILLDLVLNNSFVSIGKMYNVSDNAVRNWCKKYNLPYKRKDIILFKSSKKE